MNFSRLKLTHPAPPFPERTSMVTSSTKFEAEETKLLEVLSKQGQTLSDKRKSAAEKLGKGIETELDDLKMAAARFGVDFQTRPDQNGVPLADGTRVAFDQNGFDRV